MTRPLSGKISKLSLGGVTTYDIRSWSKNDSADNQSFVSSQTGGKTYHAPGNKNMSFNISLYAPDGAIDLVLGAGDSALIAVTTFSAATVTEWSGMVLIDSIDLTVDIESGANIGMEIVCSPRDASAYSAPF